MKKLFSIILLFLCSQTIFSQELSKGMEQTAWNSIRAKFLGNSNDIMIFRKDIALKLEGNYTTLDSVYFIELVNQLKTIMPNRKILITKEQANLIFSFGKYHGIGQTKKWQGNSLTLITVNLDLSPNITPEARKKILYYYLYRSLVSFSHSRTESTVIAGCVFDENDSEKITYSPFDAFILGKLYAPDFKDQFKNDYTKRFSYRQYLVRTYANQLKNASYFLALLCGLILTIVFLLKGVFRTKRRNWSEYNKQGLFIIFIGTVYWMITGLSDLRISTDELFILFYLIVHALIAVNLIYLAEHFLLREIDSGGLRIIAIFLITAVSLILVWAPDFRWGNISLFLPFALIRTLYIFLNDRYNSIINEKDVEIAKINELHKQAELQSLQAKINPHFLYNALNSIASLASTDSKKTEQMALSLSDFFKYAINREQKQFNSLSEELNAIRTYLEIEKVRFGERLNFEIDSPPELEEVQIPQLLIQPLVENAIKHGLSQITEKGMIRISICKEEKQLKIKIYDNGPAFPEGPLSGYGIQNTQERLSLLFGEKASINWYNGAEKYIELNLPIKPE